MLLVPELGGYVGKLVVVRPVPKQRAERVALERIHRAIVGVDRVGHVRRISRAARDADARAFLGTGHGFRCPERERRRGRGVEHARLMPPGPRGRLRGHRARDARGGSDVTRDGDGVLLLSCAFLFRGDERRKTLKAALL